MNQMKQTKKLSDLIKEYKQVSQVDHMLSDVSRYINSISGRNGYYYSTEEYNRIMEPLMDAIFKANEVSLDRINKVIASQEEQEVSA